MLEDLNELEQIGLAFLCGIAAGQALKDADMEVEQELSKNNKKSVDIAIEKLQGKNANKFIEMMKKWGIE